MKITTLFFILNYSNLVMAISYDFSTDLETRRITMIADIVTANLKKNGWSTILCVGNFPDALYRKLQNIHYPFAITNIDREDEDIEDVVHYYSNTIIIDLLNIEDYDDIILKLRNSPYWHPHANVILYYHQLQDHDLLAKLYFSLWYYKAINAIIVQYNDNQEELLISHYSPYISDGYKLDNLYDCWTTRKIGMPISSFNEGFTCEQYCRNMSVTSKLRANNLGTCIGFSTIVIPYNASAMLETLNLFEDKSKNLHGFVSRAFTTEVEPFFIITDNGNDNFTIGSRDGLLWNSMAKLMNFTFDLTPSKHVMKGPFNFEKNINQLFNFAFRKADLYMIPIYLFDVVVVEVDYTFPYKESGVCILSHRADFETTLFDVKTLHANRGVIIQFVLCFLCVWVTYAIYQGVEKRCLSFDQIGKDFLNAIRNVLLITLCNPPNRRSFRLFLAISIWSFFILNFAIQATVTSFLTAAKRGKEVETFEDMIDKGYLIYGMASPDLILPDTEERFRIINSRLVPVQDLFGCVENITNDKHRFCLIDCSVGHYLERNRLNDEGEQYLHIAQDRMHSHYLTILMNKHSPLTDQFVKYQITFYEAGLIKKWEHYRYAGIKEEPPVKRLGMDDFNGLLSVYCFALEFIALIFLLELVIFYFKKLLKCLLKKKTDKK